MLPRLAFRMLWLTSVFVSHKRQECIRSLPLLSLVGLCNVPNKISA